MKRAALLAVCVAVAGCGGSSTLSRAELVKKANAICAQSESQAAKLQAPTSSDAKSQAAYWDKAVPVVSNASSQLSALKPDSSTSADWNAFIGKLDQIVDLYNKAKTKFDAGDASGQKYIDQTHALALQANTAAIKVGAAKCA